MIAVSARPIGQNGRVSLLSVRLSDYWILARSLIQLIAEEYQQLLELRTRALSAAESERERAVREMETAKRKAADFEEIMKLGQHAIVIAWMNSRSSSELRAEVERAAASIEKEKCDG